MTQRTYRAWRPELWPEIGMEIGALVDDESGLTIRLDDHDGEKWVPAFEIVFEGQKAYRGIDEGLRSQQWNEEWREAVQRSESVIYVVEGSTFREQLDELSEGVSASLELQHYLVVTNNLCVDVLSDSEPDVRTLGSGTRPW